MLRQVARKAAQLRGQAGPLLHRRRFGIEPVAGDLLDKAAAAVPPGLALDHLLHHAGVDAQRAAHVAQCAARAVGDQRRRQRCAVAAVFPVDVLDHLFAPLVLEVHVDIGRLIALARQEAAEQQVGLLGADLGHVQAEADQRIGGRAAALAQDAVGARKAHDVVHSEEEGFVLLFLDEVQLVFELLFPFGL
ncbi:hypothetical protein D3C72_1239500 [compost metagenome]